jgi:hypothetical protein
MIAGDSPTAWYHASFSADSWSTAKQFLAWRDELIEAGWDGVAEKDASTRLRAQAGLERCCQAGTDVLDHALRRHGLPQPREPATPARVMVERMLDSVIGTDAAAPDRIQQAAPWEVLSGPAQLKRQRGSIVWWGFIDPDTAAHHHRREPGVRGRPARRRKAAPNAEGAERGNLRGTR